MTKPTLPTLLTLTILLTPLLAIATPTPPPHTSPAPQLSFAAFTDTHIGLHYEHPLTYQTAHHLDSLADDLHTLPTIQFTLHLGDLINHNTAQVSGTNLPAPVNQYTNNLKAILLTHIHTPFYPIIGNHDQDDYQLNPTNPHQLTQDILYETSIPTPTYAMMYNGILFLTLPELTTSTNTHPTLYAWITYMTTYYHNVTTIICSHAAIPDTTATKDTTPYWAKQDTTYWTTLFQNNPQIVMWIHGHTHLPDWYTGNHSTGLTHPIASFGHTMIFSSPYPQANWGKNNYSEDRIVIYNITASSITAHAWDHTGATGHWAEGYSHTCYVNTTFNSQAENWYAFPVFLQDNETQLYPLKLISPNVTLQLIGTPPMDLFVDPKMESPGGKEENIIGFGNDDTSHVTWTNPGMRVSGPTFLTFPSKYPDNQSLQEDGRSGQPYHSFPMGTISAAVPGQTYAFTVTARCPSGNGRFTLNASCSDWSTVSQYSVLPESDCQVINHTFGAENETITGYYTVPDNPGAWFLQGSLEFLNPTEYDVSKFQVRRVNTSAMTEDFHLALNNHWYNVTGPMPSGVPVDFSVDPSTLADYYGVLTIKGFADGDCFGMANLIFREPLFLGVNARIFIEKSNESALNLLLTHRASNALPFSMAVWQSPLFQRYPKATELLVRMVLAFNLVDVWDWPMSFYLIPFSSNPIYDHVTVTVDDGSGHGYRDPNGNLWWTCNGPDRNGRALTISLH